MPCDREHLPISRNIDLGNTKHLGWAVEVGLDAHELLDGVKNKPDNAERPLEALVSDQNKVPFPFRHVIVLIRIEVSRKQLPDRGALALPHHPAQLRNVHPDDCLLGVPVCRIHFQEVLWVGQLWKIHKRRVSNVRVHRQKLRVPPFHHV